MKFSHITTPNANGTGLVPTFISGAQHGMSDEFAIVAIRLLKSRHRRRADIQQKIIELAERWQGATK
jgi:hypothetical protein